MSVLKNISRIKREKTGTEVPLIIFRAFRHFSANYLEDIMGQKGTAMIFQNAGKDLGKEIGANLYKENFAEYMDNITKFVFDNKIGILIPVHLSENRIIIQLDECITCSGMDNIGKRICHFEVGFVAGLVEIFTSVKVKAFESKCGANGEGICEVTVEILNNV